MGSWKMSTSFDNSTFLTVLYQVWRRKVKERARSQTFSKSLWNQSFEPIVAPYFVPNMVSENKDTAIALRIGVV